LQLRRILSALLLAFPAAAQLVSPTAIPKGPNPPAIFLDGYQATCPGSFTGTFGNAAAVLQASGIVSVFFDNCTVAASSGKPTIEVMASAFGTFLQGLRYSDGTPVPQVDVVVHSMGGLIVRYYLAKIFPAGSVVAGPGSIRKGVFLATPHFGSFLAPLAVSGALGSVFGNDAQTQEMSPGSQFLLSLATWNGGLDDLAGLNAIAVAGNAGDGLETGTPKFDDGVVSLTSASLGFVRPGLTRVVPACHISDPELGILCPQNNPAIANITDSSSPVGQIIISFLTGTSAWQSIGTAIESEAPVANSGGLLLQFQDASGKPLSASSGSITTGSGTVNLVAGTAALYKESLPANASLPVVASVGSNTTNVSVNLAAATSTVVINKPGPLIHGVVPAGSAVFPYDVTPGAYVAIYGSGLAGSSATATLPYPQTLGGVTVTVGSQTAALQFVSAGQINMIWPAVPIGPVTLTVTNAAGTASTTTIVAPAVPSIFSLDGSGSGAAAAINAATGTNVGSAAPLNAGSDYVELFLTGLGPITTGSDGLDRANATVALTSGGVNCPVAYAGRVPGVPGLDQVNCQIPAGLSGAAVATIVTAAGRASNIVTLAIQ
jgi:uncharacterized protein (TIGR03437 family)